MYRAKYTFFKKLFVYHSEKERIAKSFPYNIIISVSCRLAYFLMNFALLQKLLNEVHEIKG